MPGSRGVDTALWLGILVFGALSAGAWAQSPPTTSLCGAASGPAFCSAVRGARAEGWPAQSRSEVMAQHGMVVTSQPLAAQAGLQILMRGGNAIDAAVATAGVLNLVEPMMVGVGGDLFAVIYIAKEQRGLCAECERHGSFGRDRRSGSTNSAITGIPKIGGRRRECRCRDLAGDRTRYRLGLAGSAQTLRHADLQAGARTGGTICAERLSRIRTHRATTGICRTHCR